MPSVGGFGAWVLSTDTARDIERGPGVAAAFPSVQVSANPDNVAIVSLGVADYIQSRDPREA